MMTIPSEKALANYGLFVTATGTDIGKTYLTSSLLQYDQLHHQILSASKPLISGWHATNASSDTALLLRAQNLPFNEKNIDWCSPWRFKLPLTPWMAMPFDAIKLRYDQIIYETQQKLKEAHQQQKCHLIEGVGGVMAPLLEHYTMLDWIAASSLSCLLVTGSYLGTLSHTLTAVHTLKSRGVTVTAVIINESVNSAVPLEQTATCLKAFLPGMPCFTLTYQSIFELENFKPLYDFIVQEKQSLCIHSNPV